jgi:hypothetical protein
MAIVKRMLCLANSRKLQGRCIAGKELVDALDTAWIRPVSAREHEEVSEGERRYANGSDPLVLDIIDVPLLAPRPRDYQQENWLLDPDHYWEKRGRASWDALSNHIDAVAPLWVDGNSSFTGHNDRIALEQTRAIRSSLRLIRLDRLRLAVFKPGEAFGDPKRRVQGRFHHGGGEYHLWVTDPIYERRFLGQDDGEYEIGECFLTVSLGEPHKGFCYKLIATIIERGRESS